MFKNVYSIEEVLLTLNKRFKDVLDIGCGAGRNLPILSKITDKIYGVDISPKMLHLSEHICKKNNLNYELKIGDIYNLPFEDGYFDCAFINMVMHHISNPSRGIGEIKRCLANGGKLIFIDLLSHSNEEMQTKYADLWLGFSDDEIESYFTKNGFTIENKIVKEDKTNNLNGVIILVLNKN